MEWFNNRRLLRPIGDTNDHLEDLKFVMPIKAIVDKNGGAYEKDWRSLKLLELALALTGKTEDQAKKTVAPLRELHSLRNPAKAHGDPQGKRMAIVAVRKAHGTLRNHFTDLSERLASALKMIVATLPK